MAVEVAGEGEAVLMVHGLGGTSNTFTPQMAALGGRFRVLRPDLPGSGRSPLPGSLSIGAMAAALAELCEVVAARAVHIVAHSLGTILAQLLAVEHPGLVRSLCLLGALSEPPEAARAGLRARAAAARETGMDGVADAVIAGSLAAETRAGNLAAVAFVRESLMRQDAEAYARTCEALADARAAEATQIRAPTLLLTGEDDTVAPSSVARQLAERIPGARADVLPRCGHWSTIERAEEVNRRLLAHLSQRAR
jgi:pimeloyl-ACP methyl ester carboxylesterase